MENAVGERIGDGDDTDEMNGGIETAPSQEALEPLGRAI